MYLKHDMNQTISKKNNNNNLTYFSFVNIFSKLQIIVHLILAIQLSVRFKHLSKLTV